MRLNHTLLGVVGLLAMGGTGACGVVADAKAANAIPGVGVSIEISPNRTSPGSTVAIRANCVDASDSATITSRAFGTLAAQRSHTSSTLLVADVEVPITLKPGVFEVTITCPSGATATTKLTVVSGGQARPTKGPHTGGGFLAGGESGTGAAPWLAGSAATLILVAGASAVALRRRRVLRRRALADR